MFISDLVIEGKVRFINPTEQKTEKFSVRTLAIDCTTTFNGQVYENFVGLQFANKNCQLLDTVSVGDEIRVKCGLSGRLYTKEGAQGTAQNPTGDQCFTNIVGYDVEVIKRAGAQPNPATSVTAEAASTKPSNNHPEGQSNVEDDLPF